MYVSAVSRTNQAGDTFFSLAITSRASYVSGGKPINAPDGCRALCFHFLCISLFRLHATEPVTPTTLHHTLNLLDYSRRSEKTPDCRIGASPSHPTSVPDHGGHHTLDYAVQQMLVVVRGFALEEFSVKRVSKLVPDNANSRFLASTKRLRQEGPVILRGEVM